MKREKLLLPQPTHGKLVSYKCGSYQTLLIISSLIMDNLYTIDRCSPEHARYKSPVQTRDTFLFQHLAKAVKPSAVFPFSKVQAVRLHL
jgi:hypothetical protein